MAYYIDESNLAYYLFNDGNYTQTTNEDTLNVVLNKERNQVIISVNNIACEPIVVKAGVIEQFEADKKADILYTPRSEYRLFIRIITDCITAFCRKNNLPFTGVIVL